MSSDQPDFDYADQALPEDDLESALPSVRRTLPWSDRTIFVVSLVVVLVLTPIWLGPQLLGGTASSSPTPISSPTARPSPTMTVQEEQAQ